MTVHDDTPPPALWCILRPLQTTRTVALARTLVQAGIPAWTPLRTSKRERPQSRRQYVLGLRKNVVEVTAPIVPGFVFASADHLTDIIAASADPDGPHPAFRLLHVGARVPFVGERQMAGLRAAEADAAAALAAEREAETRKAERHARAERLGTERERRKALRRERMQMSKGDRVTINDVPALAGMAGTIVEGRGTSAVICFGGALTMEVEAWRLCPVGVLPTDTRDRDAA